MAQVSPARPLGTGTRTGMDGSMIAVTDIKEEHNLAGSSSGTSGGNTHIRSGTMRKDITSSGGNHEHTETLQVKENNGPCTSTEERRVHVPVLPISRQIWDGGMLKKIPFRTPIIRGQSTPQYRYLRLRRIDDNDEDDDGDSDYSDCSGDDDEEDDGREEKDIGSSPPYAFRTPSPRARPKKRSRRKVPNTGTTTPNSGIGKLNANKYNSVEVSVVSRNGAGSTSSSSTGRLRMGHHGTSGGSRTRTTELASNPLCLEWFEQPNGGGGSAARATSTARSPSNNSVSNRKVMYLQDITEIQSGHSTPAFAAYGMTNGVRSLPDASLCFSIIGRNRTLDFAAASVHEATIWKTALVALLDEYRNWSGSDRSRSPGAGGRTPRSNRRGQFASRLTSPASSVGSPSTTCHGEWDEAKNCKVFVAAKAGNIKTLQKYFDRGCPVDVMEPKSGDTPLLLACRLGHRDVVDLTLKRGASNDPHPNFGQTALQAAVSAGHVACVRLLLETAAESGADAIIANHEEVCSDGIRREAPIHVASRCGSLSIVELLVMHGANIALVDSSGRTCLHCSTQSGHVACLKYLLDAGGDAYIEKRNDLGHTALHLGIQNNRLECVKIIVEMAADVNVYDNYGTSALDMARSRKLRKITQLLLDYGATDEDDAMIDAMSMSAVTYDDMSLSTRGSRVELMNPRSSRSTTILPRPHVGPKRYNMGGPYKSQSARFDDFYVHDEPMAVRPPSAISHTYMHSSYKDVSRGATLARGTLPATGLPAPFPDSYRIMRQEHGQAPSFPRTAYGHDTMPRHQIPYADTPYGDHSDVGFSHDAVYGTKQQYTGTLQAPYPWPHPPSSLCSAPLSSSDPAPKRLAATNGNGSAPSSTQLASTNSDGAGAGVSRIDQQAATDRSPVVASLSLRASNIESGVNDDDLTTYRLMIKQKVPAAAVRHKMTLEGITSEQIDAFFATDEVVTAFDTRVVHGGSGNGEGTVVAANDGDSGELEEKSAAAAAEDEADADPRSAMLAMIRSRGGQTKGPSDSESSENADDNRAISNGNRSIVEDNAEADPLSAVVDMTRGVCNGTDGAVDRRSAMLEMIRARAGKALVTETKQTRLPNVEARSSNDSISNGASAPKPALDLSDETQKAISKYKRMLNMRVPDEAVKHAMKRDGYSYPTIIAAVFDSGTNAGIDDGDDGSDKPPKQPCHMSAPDIDTSKPTKAGAAKDPVLAKYALMCRVGVPTLSAIHKMTQEGVAQEKIALFKVAYGIEDAKSANKARKAKNTSFSPPTSSKRPSTAVMQKIHWTAVTEDDKLQDSVWTLTAGRDEGALDDSDLLELENVFAVKPTAGKRAPPDSTKKAKKQNITLIDPKRAYNVAIALAQFRDFESFHALVSAVVAQDSSRLNAEKLQNMTNLLPTTDELAIIKRHAAVEDKAEGLGTAERFFLAVSRVPRFALKLDGFLYSVNFQSQTEELRKSIDTLSRSCNQVVSSSQLGLMLRRILAVGNVINDGRRKARGITLASLLKTATKKGNDNKTLLDHVVASVMKQGDPDGIVNFMSSMPSVKDAKRIDLKDLRATLRGLEGGLTQIRNVVAEEETNNEGICSDEATAAFISKSSRFVVEAEASIKSIASLLDEAETKVERLCKFFAEDPRTCEASSILLIIIEFSLLVNKAKDSWERRNRAAKRKMRKTPVRPKTAPGGVSHSATRTSSAAAHPSDRGALLSAIKSKAAGNNSSPLPPAIKGRKKPTPPVVARPSTSAGQPPPDRNALLLAIANSRRKP